MDGLSLRAALARRLDDDVKSDVKVVRVDNDEAAVRLRFLGSPTVRIDGIDVDPSACARDDYGLQCRVYSVDGRLVGAPPAEWIESALRREALHAATAAPDDCCSCSAKGEL